MTTWEERIYGDGVTPDERGELWEEFTGKLASEARELLANSGFAHEFHVKQSKARVMISSEEGLSSDDAAEVRDYLAGHEIGDESVTVAVEPMGDDGEPRESTLPVWNGYRVSVMLHEYLASKQVMEKEVTETVNEAFREE